MERKIAVVVRHGTKCGTPFRVRAEVRAYLATKTGGSRRQHETRRKIQVLVARILKGVWIKVDLCNSIRPRSFSCKQLFQVMVAIFAVDSLYPDLYVYSS